VSTEETKEKILEAAIDEFAEFGYKNATVRSISRRAEANLAAINYHFSSKKELYRNVLESVFASETSETRGVEMPSGRDVDSQEKLEAAAGDWIKIFMSRLICGSEEEGQRKYRICIHEMLSPSDIFDELANKYIRKDIEPLMSIVSKGMPENTSREKILQKTFSVLGRCFFYRFHDSFVKNLAKEEDFTRRNYEMIVDQIIEETTSGLNYLN
jgi:AcrR family transcriptional regulator